MKLTQVILALFSYFIMSPSNACTNQEKVVAYFNGVGNSPSEAQTSLRKIIKMLNVDPETIRKEIFYNPTEGALQDVFEVFKQKIQETPEFSKHWELF